MPVSSVSNIQQTHQTPKRPFLNPVSVTGYAATGCGIGSVVAINNKSLKWHKNLAYAAAVMVLAHIGIIELRHNQKHSRNIDCKC